MEQNEKHVCNEYLCICLNTRMLLNFWQKQVSTRFKKWMMQHIFPKFGEVANIIEIIFQPENEYDVKEELSISK